MRVLIVKLSPIDSPASSMMRTIALAKGLKELGHEVTFLSTPIGPQKANWELPAIAKSFELIQTKDSATYSRLSSVDGLSNMVIKAKRLVKAGVRFLWRKLVVYDFTYTIARNTPVDVLIQKEFDIVISSSDPKSSHLLVDRLRKQGMRFSTWIQYWGDPLADDINKMTIYPRLLVAFIESRILSRADKVVYVSPLTLTSQQRRFRNIAGKMRCLPVPYIDPLHYRKSCNSKFTVGYYGDYRKINRDIRPLYDAIKATPDVHLNIVGDGNISLNPTDNITIKDRGNISDYQANTDLLVCVLNKGGTQIPGKIYHCAATNKPILIIIDGENGDAIKRFFEPYNRFYFCNNTAPQIIAAIRLVREEAREFEPCMEFSARKIAEAFLRLSGVFTPN